MAGADDAQATVGKFMQALVEEGLTRPAACCMTTSSYTKPVACPTAANIGARKAFSSSSGR
jgi:hypothetical protein